MLITYYGHSCFKLEYKVEDKNVELVIDPYSPELGYSLPQISVDFAVITHHHYDHDYLDIVSFKNKEKEMVIDSPGEYEIQNVFVQGIEAYHDKSEGAERGKVVMYRITGEEISLAHLGDLGTELNSNQIELLENVDILLVPIGGKYTINAKEAIKVINQIEPKIVIPMHYKLEKSNLDIDGLDNFLQELGMKVEENLSSQLKVNKNLFSTINDNFEVHILKPFVK